MEPNISPTSCRSQWSPRAVSYTHLDVYKRQGYINERLTADIPTALRFATALVSLKMETPGPFTGTRADVDAYLKEFY